MKKLQFIALSIALLLNLPLSASQKESNGKPDASWYQVDLVVFRYLNNDSGEAWPTVAGYRLPTKAIRLKTHSAGSADNSPLFEIVAPDNQLSRQPDIVRDAYIALPANERLLNNQVTSLEKSGSYQVITQKAWRMPVSSESGKQPIAIRALIGGQDTLLLQGTVSVSEERFLHVDIDLWLNKLSPESLYSTLSGKQHKYNQKTSGVLADSHTGSDNLVRLHDGSPPLRITDNFQIKQRRRIRNTKEIQYIDSPEIGVLIKLTPYDRPDALVETGMTISQYSS
ncbi:CsiV family protein [Endozoicomonas sp. SCSIO W0465]|uniref:CsiV family protein n=1 Tax=Endozoicomonas sp. SCSIO W0465 TaxID=2918516 RepID=UPI002076556F|nr:CsiV family protein [Endozoicomonas sp. SCSIO W0465]USE39316.1 peptidoglycan binding protein CsiV [Endozoicomonas sp. SCSIO W0465]